MKLPYSKIYWADFLSFSNILSAKEICQVLKIIALKSMSYENPQDNLQDNPQVSIQKQIQKQIFKLNQIQLNFYECMNKALEESAKGYFSSVKNGRLGGRPKKNPTQPVSASASNQPEPLPRDCSTYADDKSSKRVSYKWEGEVIKLNDKDFTTWLNKYTRINLRRVLESRDDWLATQPDRIKKGWYLSTIKWLEKLNNEAA